MERTSRELDCPLFAFSDWPRGSRFIAVRTLLEEISLMIRSDVLLIRSYTVARTPRITVSSGHVRQSVSLVCLCLHASCSSFRHHDNLLICG